MKFFSEIFTFCAPTELGYAPTELAPHEREQKSTPAGLVPVERRCNDIKRTVTSEQRTASSSQKKIWEWNTKFFFSVPSLPDRSPLASQSKKYLVKSPRFVLNFIVLLLLFVAGACAKPKPDERASLSITSMPDTAKVFIDGKEVGLTPLKIKVPADTYIIQLEKEGYERAFRRIICEKRKEHNLEVNLEPITASVLLLSNPPGAIVTRNGVQLGETPIVLNGLTVAKHSASFSKPGYLTTEVFWNVEDARPQQILASLGTNRGKLVFESEPPDADIFVDDKFIGKTPHEEYFEQGEKKIRIQKSDYIVFEQKVSVVKDQERKVLAKLSLLPGKLIVKSVPPGAAIYLNGELTKEAPAEFANLFPGQYSIRLELPNHDTETREVTVSPGRETELTIPMSTNLGGIDIVANPPGVVVYLDGKKEGVTVPDQNKAISKIFEIRKVPSGKHTITLLHHRAVPQEIKFEVNVEKGKTSRPKPVTMWIADTYVKLKNGREMNGRLRQENEDFIIFEPEPSIHIQYRKDEIDILKKLFVE